MDPSLLGPHERLVEKTKGCLIDAAVTKAESLICQTLQRGGKKMQTRLEDFVARCARDINGNWKDELQEDLAELVNAALDAPAV